MTDKRELLKAFVDDQPAVVVDRKALNAALYSMSELGLWPDNIDSMSNEQAILVWALVERVRREGFPTELRM